MFSLIISIIFLIVGYFTYGKFVERIFGPDDRKTPAYTEGDGVDFVPLKLWKSYLIQLLNIAGTGPIFGALMGACFGPIVFVWIVVGCIFGGAVHDYMTGMISLRHKGASIAQLSGIYFSNAYKWVMRIFAVVLLILVGTVFVTSPAALLGIITPDFLNENFWIIVIFIYYFMATLLPIDKLIGRLYPIFGSVLIIMTIAILGGCFVEYNIAIPEISFTNMHPDGLPIWPFMFVTVACGAISGFHATQSPMISKCLEKEKQGRKVFYGAMISEGIIALAWAAAGVCFYESTGGLYEALSQFGQSATVYDISMGMLGPVGGVLAIIGVVFCPITSGDTAFRSARLILAETFNLRQSALKHRLIIATLLFLISGLLSLLDFDILWRYFSWANQTLAMLALAVFTTYLLTKKNKWLSLVTAIPCAFMGAVTFTYILMAPEGFRLDALFAYPAGIMFAIVIFTYYLYYLRKELKHDA
ncbi:MAG: carbon starvation CstA family protein [Coriobacteriia bacterium]|nr:carbon starvation CstA family protein [Coriobacteriia bacterium]